MKRRASSRWTLLGALGITGAVALVRRSRRVATGRSVPGGLLMADVGAYDMLSRLVFGRLFRGIAADIAASASTESKILEVGCGPGLLSVRLAHTYDLDVTGLDLDPAMIERARANAGKSTPGHGTKPSFVVGDVAALPFRDGSFDLVVSTFSMHHWSDRAAALTEIARVLRPGGKALVWDLRPHALPFHPAVQQSHDELSGSPLGAAKVTPWRWPARLSLAERIEFAGVRRAH